MSASSRSSVRSPPLPRPRKLDWGFSYTTEDEVFPENQRAALGFLTVLGKIGKSPSRPATGNMSRISYLGGWTNADSNKKTAARTWVESTENVRLGTIETALS